MENFSFYSPTYFEFGKDTEMKAGTLVKRFGGSKVMIVYGGGSVVRSGLLDRVKGSLESEGIGFVELGSVKPNPRSGLVYKGIDICRKEKVDFLLAVGGGSTIDTSKMTAEVPAWMQKAGRTYYLLTCHNGVVTVADKGKDTSFSWESSRFSTYMIALKDADDSDDEDGSDIDGDGSGSRKSGSGRPGTGDDSTLLLWALLMFASAGGLVILYRERGYKNQ